MDTQVPRLNCSDIIERIRNRPDLPVRRKHDLTSAIKRFCQRTARKPRDVPADPDQLDGELAKLPRLGLSTRSYRNLKSLFRQAIVEGGAATAPRKSAALITLEWQQLLTTVEESAGKYRLPRFARYCSERDIRPDEVDQGIVEQYRQDLSTGRLYRPSRAAGDTIRAWNRLRSIPAGSHLQELRNQRCQSYLALAPAAFPLSFQQDLDAYLESLKSDDLFGERGGRAVSPDTVITQRRYILQLASALAETGRDPTSITLLSDLVVPQSARATLMVIYRRLGERKTGHLHNLSHLLFYIGKHRAKLPEDQLAELRGLRRHCNPRTVGMSRGNSRRLKQFEDPINVARLLGLPERLMAEALRRDRGRREEAVLAQIAVVIQMLLAAPLRVRTLVSLQRDEHTIRSRLGPRAVVNLVIPPELVKNRTPLEFVLPPRVVKLLDLYWERFRPRLVTGPGSWLFPGRNGPKNRTGMGMQISETIYDATSLRMHPHLFRHFAAYMILRRNPGDYETVRVLLGHRSIETTVKFYCGMEQAAAFARYDEIIAAHLAEEENDE
jgi:integrase